MLDFIKIGFIDILDIFLVGLLIYQAYKLIKGTAAMNIFTGVLVFYFIWIIVKALHMDLLGEIMGQIIGVGGIALVILFQQEIRRFLLRIGTRYIDSRKQMRLVRAFMGKQKRAISLETLEEITLACKRMAETKTGALIVLAHSSALEVVAETGDRIDALVNRRLIETIFFKNTPLHDGAMLIFGEKIVAVRCTLPISESHSIPAYYGMRHRAAIGITEQSDASVIVVSEQRGEISFVTNGEIKSMNSINELRLAIENSYK
ncbi:MAG: diadenylate cyclase CdaA [Bacteroidales bacterium]|nr:diadenylate cyclase CdaA [Bacteroidales bacterium]